MAEKAVRLKLSLWKKLVFTGLIVAAPLLLFESLLRYCGYGPKVDLGTRLPVPTGLRKINALEYFAVSDPYLGVRNRPNGRYRKWYIEGNPLTTTDEFGYRNGFGWPGGGESPIVLFVGDSVTFCSEVNDHETGPSEVAKLLREEFDIRVLNAAVRSYNTLQAKRMLINCLERFPCIKVAVYTFCGNDLEENVVPHFRYPFEAPFLVRDEESGKFREVEVSDPAVPWGEGFLGWEPPQPVFSRRAKLTKWFEVHSALFHRCFVGWRRIDSRLFSSFEFPDGKQMVPPSDYEKWHDWAAQNGGNQALQQLLAEMDQICRRHGTVFVTTCSLDGSDVGSSRAFAANCAKAGVQFVSLEKEFTEKPSVYTCLRVDGRYDEHYGPSGTKAYAGGLAPALKRILRSQASDSAGARRGQEPFVRSTLRAAPAKDS